MRMNQKATNVYIFSYHSSAGELMKFSFRSELVLYLEGIFASCVKNEELAPMFKLCVHL